LYLVTVYNKPVKEVKEIWQNADALLAEAERIYCDFTDTALSNVSLEIINQFDTAPHFKSFIRVHPDPKIEILEFAAKNNCDYIVMGTRGISGRTQLYMIKWREI
jgi:nucleotide-binding universal stress UspA family protein